MAKIYLAKSNKSNPNHVIHVRQTLIENGHEVVEFLGGEYSDQPMLECDAVVSVVTEYDHSSEKQTVGRGLYDQASVCIFGQKRIPFYVFVPRKDPNKKEAYVGLDVTLATETIRKPGDSWTDYGFLIVGEEVAPLSYLHPSPKKTNEGNQEILSTIF